MTTNHDIDFPTSANVGRAYDNDGFDDTIEIEVMPFIKSVRVVQSEAVLPHVCNFQFVVEWVGEGYDKQKALSMARYHIEGAFMAKGEHIVSFAPFRRKDDPYSRFWVRVEFWKDDKR
jgi:hypothetical protein